jgi:hypothetical protein
VISWAGILNIDRIWNCNYVLMLSCIVIVVESCFIVLANLSPNDDLKNIIKKKI